MDPNRPGFAPVDRKTGSAIPYTDMAFVTSRPLDVPSRNRIMAVCSIFDHDNHASPKVDGIFLSDFYLFYHLLHPVCTHSANQIWLTTESPRYLVQKYGEYAHGDPRQERRVVLEKSLLQGIHDSGNLRVVASDVLLDRFAKTVQEQARLARSNSETLIILIFGHGQFGTHSIYIGGKGKNTFPLYIPVLKRMIPSDVQVTLFMTSCYSGGWLVQPAVDKSKHPNVTGIAASGPGQETRSWSFSKSLSRACGTSVATAILQQMIEIEEKEDAEEEAYGHPTYIGLAGATYDKAQSLDRFMDRQQIYFSAQDDEWESQWQARTGAPLLKFKERWASLRETPPEWDR